MRDDEWRRQERLRDAREVQALHGQTVETVELQEIEDVDGIPISVNGSITRETVVFVPEAFGFTKRDMDGDPDE